MTSPALAPPVAYAPSADPERLLYCPDCAHDRMFSAVDCREGHGVQCPDLACTHCGAAVSFSVEPQWRSTRRSLRDAA